MTLIIRLRLKLARALYLATQAVSPISGSGDYWGADRRGRPIPPAEERYAWLIQQQVAELNAIAAEYKARRQ